MGETRGKKSAQKSAQGKARESGAGNATRTGVSWAARPDGEELCGSSTNTL